MYKGILFDLDDTLFNLQACETEALRNSLSKTLVRLTSSQVWPEVLTVYRNISMQYWKKRSIEGYSREQVVAFSLRDTLQVFNENTTHVPELASNYWIQFCQSPQLNPGARTTLNLLHSRYRLGVITNGDSEAQRGRLKAADLLPFFSIIIISDEVGVSKPDVRIFEIALTKLAISPKDALYVGDSIRHDYQGCQSAGLAFCHYLSNQVPYTDLPITKFRISSLKHLPRLLDQESS